MAQEPPGRPRGYFGVGIEGISKPMNLGNLMRSAHAFGASFLFTVDPGKAIRHHGSDTSRSSGHVPYFSYPDVEGMNLPAGCALVGVELVDDAIDLPSFHHPLQAAYVFGPEKGSLSPAMLERCDYTVKIPTVFCINVATAGAIIMYDRVATLGRFDPRPVMTGGPVEQRREHVHGGIYRRGPRN